ncbi:calcium/sodium antiporter [Spirulina subsalsa FACHB-351]|uniref:Calcium/sodium antiporter n=1 Tax=Spirulina subsalsa FACHB-351 TaxID=234711 RepID=A0ABT3L0M6_9CYAN|nr:calcium/sodium antiporter [Spirulina subsalsa]MCW6035048.1 calcium/sodium antiporter [Spirulina subsalsa FACHB-351]
MSPLILWLLVLVISLAVLAKASDIFIEAAEKIGLYLRLPAFIVGVTIVAIGTSLPELVSSILAVLQNSSEIVFGNVVGSNIANIFLIIGAASVLHRKLKIQFELIHVDLPLFVGSAFLWALMVSDRHFSIFEALLCIAGYITYSIYTVSSREEENAEACDLELPRGFLWQQIGWIVLSATAIFFGAKYTVESVIELAEILQIGTAVIAVSVVAIGTSLPEFFVSFSAARKGNIEIAVGNVLGSNIFNTLVVMGIPRLVGKLIIPPELLFHGMATMLAGTLMFFFVTQDKQITRWEGWLFFIFYLWFIGSLFEFI